MGWDAQAGWVSKSTIDTGGEAVMRDLMVLRRNMLSQIQYSKRFRYKKVIPIQVFC